MFRRTRKAIKFADDAVVLASLGMAVYGMARLANDLIDALFDKIDEWADED